MSAEPLPAGTLQPIRGLTSVPHVRDPLDVRGRVEGLLAGGTFVEFGSKVRHRTTAFGMTARRPASDGVLTGIATIDGRPVAVFAQDPRSLGGSLGEMHASKIVRIMEHAKRARMPLIGLIDSGGARIQEGVAALDGYGEVFRRNVALSGRSPQISVVLGPCAGGAVYSPALTDFVIMARDRAHMFVTGPKVVKAVTHEDVTAQMLGGSDVHSRSSGVAHLVADDVDDALRLARRVLSYLPNSCYDDPPDTVPVPPHDTPHVPTQSKQTYDVRSVVRSLVDTDSFLELQEHFGANLVVGFARLDGKPIGIVANQPNWLAGTLDITASEKAARFVRMCDSFGLPLVVLVDTPGFLPGRNEESGGIIRKGAKLLYAFSEATVPRITVILRKAYGGAYIVMNSKSLGADAVYAWPGSQLAVMGAEGAVDIIYRKEIAEDPDRKSELVGQYESSTMNPELAAEKFSVDEIIEPAETRGILVHTLDTLIGARRSGFRHDNLPQ